MYLTPDHSIQQTQSRQTVEIHLPDGRIFEGPRGMPVGVFLRSLPEWDNPPIVGAIVNDELRELTYPIELESRVRP
ncbi:MAG TPA: nucleoside kinase, partial [Anaerolineaceae bacterium]|nr:nucleoside kinase [Anaerolineaceae bacterium]